MKSYPLEDDALHHDESRRKGISDGIDRRSFDDGRVNAARNNMDERKSFNGDRPSLEAFESESFLKENIAFFFQNRLTILAVTFLAFLAGISYALLSTPIYYSDSLIQVEKREGGKLKGLSELSDLLNSATNSTDAEIAILGSRSVVGKVVKDLNLECSVDPIGFPLIGAAIARLYKGEGPAEPLWGFASYAWGGEKVTLDTLDVPKDLIGLPFTLTAGANGSFTLLDPNDQPIIQGQVGELATAGEIKVLLSTLEARPGTRFRLVRVSNERAVSLLQKQLRIFEKKRNSGIISIALEGSDSQKTAKIINAVIDAYVRQDIDRRSEESLKMLDFLTAQLPRIRNELKTFETELTDYRTNTGTLGMSIEARTFVEASSKIEEQLALLRLQKAELEQRFTGNHPTLIAAGKKIAELTAERKKLSSRIKNLPSTELPAVQLERDTRVANGIYVQLLNRIQELSVAKAGTIGNVHVIDVAEPSGKPTRPEKAKTAIFSIIIGLLLGIGIAFVRRSLVKGIEDPEEIEHKLGIPVYCTIPHSERQSSAGKTRSREDGSLPLLNVMYPQDPAIESIRSLRTSLHFALMDAPNNIIMLTGPSPDIGKSFVSSNLTACLAEGGQKILLIDADMRRGHLHDLFGVKRRHGLSELISHNISLDKALHSNILPNLDFISSGVVPPNPSELLMNERYRDLMIMLSRQYDIVLLDTPPLLAVTDACLIARSAGTCFLVVGYGRHQLREIDLACKRLDQAQRRVQAIIVNNLPMRFAKHRGYHYQYKY